MQARFIGRIGIRPAAPHAASHRTQPEQSGSGWSWSEAAQLDAMGPRRAQLAVTKGQHTHPDGRYYGGAEPTWSQLVFRDVLRRHAGRCHRLAWIDVHSGLGPFGVGERIFACPDTVAWKRQVWAQGLGATQQAIAGLRG